MNLSTLLHNEFEKRKNRNQRYSIRAFAKSLEMEAGALLRLMQGRRTAKDTTAISILKKLEAPLEVQSLILRELENRRQMNKKRMIAPQKKIFPIHEFEDHIDIHHIYTLEALNLQQFKKTHQVPALASALRISLDEATNIINLLTKLGAISVLDENFAVVYKSFSAVPYDFPSEKRKMLQKEFLKKAQEAIDLFPPELRETDMLSIPISSKDIEKIKMILKHTYSKIHKISAKRTKHSHLYNLCLAFYPVVVP
ncbi:DUF4423 domain-containing protein [Bdellovibrio sp. BCCA]|uniref:DUF4423 domain-containing protein n=1 Tax=Bdellovibrio sp. BCCA TaxID=3136281 RepID=UPI0030F2C558